MILTRQFSVSLKSTIDRGECMRVNMIRKFFPAIIIGQKPEFAQVIRDQFSGVQQFWRKLRFRILLMMFIECPKPCAKAIKLKIRPVAMFAIRSVQAIARVQNFSLSECFTRISALQTMSNEPFFEKRLF